MTATTTAATSILTCSSQALYSSRSISSTNGTQSISTTYASNSMGITLRKCVLTRRNVLKISGKISAVATAATVQTTSKEETKEITLPSWAQFEMGKASVFWKTMNGLPPTAGEKLRLFYNPASSKIAPNDDFGIAFNGGFNQPIMCGGEPRAMLRKSRGKADSPIYSIQICIPKHALNLIFSFTNGEQWDGPYKLQFEVPRSLKNKPIEFFNEGLAEELSKEGACDQAIFPDTDIIARRCAMIGNLTVEGGDRCNLDLVAGCTDPSSPSFDPLANVDDGSCPIELDDDE